MSSETFTYKGISAGKYIEGEIEAINQEEASFKLKEQKIIITNLIKVKKKKADLQKNERDFAMDYLLNPQFDEDTPFIEKAIRTVYSWQPEWFVSWGASIANRTMDMGLGIIDAVQSEKMAKGLMQGYTLSLIHI